VAGASSQPPALLEDAYVLTCDDASTRGELAVAVADERIAAVGPAATLRRRFPRAQRVRCRGRVLLPGLVNAHLHPDLHMLKGELEELGLHDWVGARRFNAAVAFLDTAEGRPLQRAAIRASFAEAVLGGTTCVGAYGVTDGAEALCEEAFSELGLRGHVTIRDVSFPQLATPPLAEVNGPRARIMYRLHAEERLDEAELQAAAVAHARGERLVMHAAETAHRVHLSRQHFGATTVRLLHRRGLLSPRMLLSHAVHIDAEEIDLIARHGAPVVVSPAAEMKLSDGVPPVVELLRQGVPVALGTDAAVCNNGTDMFLEMKLLGLAQKLRYGAASMPAEQILLMATRHGAAALGEADVYGALVEGMAADLILVDANSLRMQPLVTDPARPNVAANLVYAATAADVTDVMIAGRWIVRRRRLLTASARTIARELDDAARRLHELLRDRE
jgi:5-methylthioadenosine/S-adenosylhomocysteine deaminase